MFIVFILFTVLYNPTMADKKTPFPDWLKPLLGDVHAISEAKAEITAFGKSLELTAWRLDSDLRKRRKKLETKILTILKAFQDQMEHHNWVKFIETSTDGHETLNPHVDALYEEMHSIKEEYTKLTSFLDDHNYMKKKLEEKEETLTSALNHMKFTEKHLHYLGSSKYDDYDSGQIRRAMYWDGWKK